MAAQMDRESVVIDHPHCEPHDERIVRVFVSSTFSDMHEERDQLVKFVFPRLKKICEERDVIWSEVDLRWGVTSEQRAEGKVLPICLGEIDRSNVFIALLGERYGWIPEVGSRDRSFVQDWLNDFEDCSVTAIEILSVMAKNSIPKEQVLFYFRDLGYLRSVHPSRMLDFVEHPTHEEIQTLGKIEALRKVNQRKLKLAELKQVVRDKHYNVLENYSNPTDLGEAVYRDVFKIIDERYPIAEIPDPVAWERSRHYSFAKSKSQIYVKREEYYRLLDEHASGHGYPLCIFGNPGTGKSALLSNWALDYRSRHPDERMIIHFVGSTSQSTDHINVLRQILAEDESSTGEPERTPAAREQVRVEFIKFLHRASVKGTLILVIDGVNQLEDRDNALNLNWLPEQIPDNVRMILSTGYGPSLDELRRRGWRELFVNPMELGERKALIDAYLAFYGKSMAPGHEDKIARSWNTSIPLFLSALLDELRVIGRADDIERRIDSYLESHDIKELYGKILERYERDYEEEFPGLVGESFRLISTARYGVSEMELLDMLRTKYPGITRRSWSNIFLAAEKLFTVRSGLLSPSHSYIRESIFDRYVKSSAVQKEVHLRLADYFQGAQSGKRRIAEVPWHYSKARDWFGLYALLKDIEFFEEAWKTDKFEVKEYWASIERNSKYRIRDAYHTVIEQPAEFTEHVWSVSHLLGEMGCLQEARVLRKCLVEHFEANGDDHNLANARVNLARDMFFGGDPATAYKLYDEAEKYYATADDPNILHMIRGAKAAILTELGQMDAAMDILMREQAVYDQYGNTEGLGRCYANQARILHYKGQFSPAVALLTRSERIFRDRGDIDTLAGCLLLKAQIFYLQNDLDRSEDCISEAEALFTLMTNSYLTQQARISRVLILQKKEMFDEAKDIIDDVERKVRPLGIKALLASCMGNKAEVYEKLGRYEEALAFNDEAERIYGDLNQPAGRAVAILTRAKLLRSLRRLKDALKAVAEAQKILREINYPELVRQAEIIQRSIEDTKKRL